MRLSAPLYRLKRRAKLLARERGIPHHEALDLVAAKEGYRGWSHLASSAAAPRPAEKILAKLSPGDLLLLGARPGHGKTLLGLELALAASRSGRKGFFFTLDYNEVDVLERLRDLGVDPKHANQSLILDTSDDISADHIIQRTDRETEVALLVIDYLQLLDQKRCNPDLGLQITALKAYAQASGAIVVAISQIDRAFELKAEGLPGRSDVRLPNPFDLSLFNKACFLHEGEIEVDLAA